MKQAIIRAVQAVARAFRVMFIEQAQFHGFGTLRKYHEADAIVIKMHTGPQLAARF